MKSPLKRLSIRTRLFVVYVAILLLGFGGVLIVVGQQVSSGALEDIEQRMMSEAILISRAVVGTAQEYFDGRVSENAMQAVLDPYEAQINAQLAVVLPQDRRTGGARAETSGIQFNNPPEVESVLHGTMTVDARQNENGVEMLYTAVLIPTGGQLRGVLQLGVPASSLQTLIDQRWLELGLVVAAVALLGIAAAFWLARSIIQPLSQLRESAVRLSQGDFAHRVQYDNPDEVGDVARAFNEMATQVVSMLEEQRAFASNTSHEMRTPLTSIRLRTEALRDNTTLEPAVVRQYIEEIDDEVKRMGNLVEDLTLLSRFDAGRTELGQERIDMQRFAASLRDRMLPFAIERGVRLTLVPPAESLLVRASISHLSILFRNLLDNAIKYTPEGGSVTWTIEAAGANVRHTIRDNGHGIDAEHLPHLFERFYRGDKAHSRAVSGTGLGLSLVRSIVDAYGGIIAVESAGVNQGTVVTVTLPCEPVDAV